MLCRGVLPVDTKHTRDLSGNASRDPVNAPGGHLGIWAPGQTVKTNETLGRYKRVVVVVQFWIGV